MSTQETPRAPLPPFTAESATQKVRLAEDAWNTRDPHRVSLAYTPDSRWRNENWEFDSAGFMRLRLASINDLPIGLADRKFHWAREGNGRRPDDYPSLGDLSL